MRYAVHFGAGNIGRGFLGQLLFEGGYFTTFVDTDAALVTALDARGNYPLRLVSTARTQTMRIGNLRAVLASDTDEIRNALVKADLVSVSVGVSALARVAPTLAAGIEARAAAAGGPLNVLLCENQWQVARRVKDLLLAHFTAPVRDYFSRNVGLTGAVVGRMVPTPTESVRAEDPLLIVTEPYQELPVDGASLRSPTPRLPGLVISKNFEAYEARKLFLHNMGHAALAYMGHLRGYEYIWQCLEDELVEQACRAAMGETCQALAAKYGFGPALLSGFADDLMQRFRNRDLGDTVARVAADPLRKLRPEDRLIGAATVCLQNGVEPKALASVIGAALCYDDNLDPSAVRLQKRMQAEGAGAVLQAVCGLESGSPLFRLISTSTAWVPC